VPSGAIRKGSLPSQVVATPPPGMGRAPPREVSAGTRPTA
jgi:hypothetical protein